MPFYISTKYGYQMPYPEVGRWRIAIRLRPEYQALKGLQWELGIYKLTQLPPEGEMITSLYYRGFRFEGGFTWNIAVEGVWNLPTGEEIKQQTLIFKTRIIRKIASLLVKIRGSIL